VTVAPGAALAGLTAFHDPEGKAFYLLPIGISPAAARRAVLATYAANGRTDYAVAGEVGNPRDLSPAEVDFPETPFSRAEVARIAARQDRNRWSYRDDIALVHAQGGRVVTTPNGMLMAVPGGVGRWFAAKGGTTWGDIFLLNIPADQAGGWGLGRWGLARGRDPVDILRRVVEGGSAPSSLDPTGGTTHWLDLDRVLHHEEIHAQQWARYGHLGFLARYAVDTLLHGTDGVRQWTEREAGLHDGGYA